MTQRISLATGQVVSVVPLQPIVDATSRQVDGGGWSRVEQWCLANSGVGMGEFFDQPLFATSPVYDAILVHLDGDVVEKSGRFNGYVPTTVLARVKRIKAWVLTLVNAELRFSKKLLTAVPTLTTESWVAAAFDIGNSGWESRDMKAVVKRFLRRRFAGSGTDQIEEAAKEVFQHWTKLEARCRSFDLFDKDIQRWLSL